MKVFAFDRDDTVDVSPPHEREAVPLAWVRHLAHETDHEVWAIGNQRLVEEADVPGVAEAIERHPTATRPDSGGSTTSRFSRAERVRLVGELFPDAEEHVVVDDVYLKHMDGWTHYYPWEFVAAAEEGTLGVSLPDGGARGRDGGGGTR